MSSNLKVNSLVPATGTEIGIGTTGGSIDFRCPATFGGNVTIGGTLTYDEVINIDSIGVITARSNIDCNGSLDVDGHTDLDNVSIAGVSTFAGLIDSNAGLDVSGTSLFRSALQAQDNLEISGEIVHLSDADTRIQFPSNDTIAFKTAGSERIRIDSNGYVGIKESSPHLYYSPDLVVKAGADAGGITIRSAGATHNNYLMFADGNSGDTRYDGYIKYSHNNRNLQFATAAAVRLTIDSAGRVGVNQSSFATSDTMFSVSETTGHCEIGIISKNDSAVVINLGDTDSYNQGRIKYDNNDNSLTFRTVGTDRLRISSDGTLTYRTGGGKGYDFNSSGSSAGIANMFCPASYTIAFGTNNNERLRIDSSGRLLVATNSAGEADSSADDLVIGNTGQGNNGMTIVTNNANNGALFFADQDGTVRGGFRYQHGVDVLQCYAGGSVSLQVKSNAIGLHENYPIANSLTIRGAATDDTPSLVLKRHTDGVQNDGEVIGRIQFMSNENNVDSGNHHTRAEIRAETQSTSGASRLEFYTVPNSTIATSLAATINGTQDFMIGTQNPDEGGAGLGFNARGFVYRPSGHAVVRSASTSISGASGICYTAKFADTGTGKAFRVMLAQTEIGSIGMGAGGTTFNTSSDYRRKENIINLTGAITRLKTLTPKRFNFKDEPSVTRDGFLAHEVTAVPEAITGTKDQVDSNNDPVYQQMDQSKLVPLLVAALQEAVARIEALEGS